MLCTHSSQQSAKEVKNAKCWEKINKKLTGFHISILSQLFYLLSANVKNKCWRAEQCLQIMLNYWKGASYTKLVWPSDSGIIGNIKKGWELATLSPVTEIIHTYLVFLISQNLFTTLHKHIIQNAEHIKNIKILTFKSLKYPVIIQNYQQQQWKTFRLLSTDLRKSVYKSS